MYLCTLCCVYLFVGAFEHDKNYRDYMDFFFSFLFNFFGCSSPHSSSVIDNCSVLPFCLPLPSYSTISLFVCFLHYVSSGSNNTTSPSMYERAKCSKIGILQLRCASRCFETVPCHNEKCRNRMECASLKFEFETELVFSSLQRHFCRE